jgi:hypothetical protein
MFQAKFKRGVIESIVYFGDWMKSIPIYDVKDENGEIFF